MENQRLIEDEDKPRFWKYKITIEPTVLLYVAASTISHNLVLNLLLDKACRIRSEEDDHCETETESQVLTSQINSWKLFFGTIFMLLFTSLAGPVIDKNPRRLPYILIIPVLGQFLCDFGNLLSVYFWSWSPWLNGVFDAVLIGFSGTNCGFYVVCLSYLSYTSSKQERTIRIGFYFFCVCVGASLGYFFGGYATDYLGYKCGFIVCLALNLLAILLELRCVEPVDISTEEENNIEDVTLRNLTILQTIQQNFTVLTKTRENNKTLVIILCLILYPIALGYPAGELSVLYLFLRRKFSWDAVDYGVFMSFKLIFKSSGAFLCAELLKRRLNLLDATIGIFGCTLQVTMSVLWIFVSYSWQVYAVTMLAMFEKAIIAVITSIASKCVELHEYGRLSALFGFTYVVTPLIYPLYNMVYETSIYAFPSSFFIISICFTTPCVLIFCILRFYSIKILERESLPV